jgi:hypothetical protein
MCLSHLIYTVRPSLIHTCHAILMPCSDHAVLLKATAQYVRRETACGLPAPIRLLPAATRRSTKVVIRTPISDAAGQCETKRLLWTRKRVVAAHYKKKKKRDDMLNCWIAVRIFSATMRTSTKDTVLSEHGRGAAWRVWINGTVWQGNSMGMAWARHAMCKAAFVHYAADNDADIAT